MRVGSLGGILKVLAGEPDEIVVSSRPDVGVNGPVDGSYFTDVDLLGDICQPRLLEGRSGKEGDRRGSDVAQQRVDPIVDPVYGQRLTGLCDRIRYRVSYIDPSESFASQKQSEDGGRSQEVVEHGE